MEAFRAWVHVQGRFWRFMSKIFLLNFFKTKKAAKTATHHQKWAMVWINTSRLKSRREKSLVNGRPTCGVWPALFGRLSTGLCLVRMQWKKSEKFQKIWSPTGLSLCPPILRNDQTQRLLSQTVVSANNSWIICLSIVIYFSRKFKSRSVEPVARIVFKTPFCRIKTSERLSWNVWAKIWITFQKSMLDSKFCRAYWMPINSVVPAPQPLAQFSNWGNSWTRTSINVSIRFYCVVM